MNRNTTTPAFSPLDLDVLWQLTLDEIERDGATLTIRLAAVMLRRSAPDAVSRHVGIFGRVLEAEGSKLSRHHFTLLHSVHLLRTGKPAAEMVH